MKRTPNHEYILAFARLTDAIRLIRSRSISAENLMDSSEVLDSTQTERLGQYRRQILFEEVVMVVAFASLASSSPPTISLHDMRLALQDHLKITGYLYAHAGF